MTLLVTGGAGFIGSNFVLHRLKINPQEVVLNLDKLSYAGNLENLSSLKENTNHRFVHGDIADKTLISQLLQTYQPRALIHFAAESHVDRSILSPSAFIETNIVGTFNLLESARHYWNQLEPSDKESFRFFHISTDEVYGSLNAGDAPFTENHRFEPNSPYSASKASSDHLVRAYYHTFGLPTVTSNCSNNYGPYQFPEKLIPLVIHHALTGKSLPIYGDGMNIRDWLYVEDHCRAISTILEHGKIGETYNVGGLQEKTNIDVVHTICDLLDKLKPRQDELSYRSQIQFVKDRLGHDRRYAIDASKLTHSLSWKPLETFETGIEKTIAWYLQNSDWVSHVVSGEYQQWNKQQYGSLSEPTT
jgi:dTDP-glucose 4,6-dehydratase